jgi:hypothetical protein
MYAENDNWRPEILKTVLVEIQVFGDIGSCVLVKLPTTGRGVVPEKYQSTRHNIPEDVNL